MKKAAQAPKKTTPVEDRAGSDLAPVVAQDATETQEAEVIVTQPDQTNPAGTQDTLETIMSSLEEKDHHMCTFETNNSIEEQEVIF